MKSLVALGAALLISGSVQAATTIIVDFNELVPFDTYNSPLVSGGLKFENPGDGVGADAFFAVGDGWVLGADGSQLVPNYFGSVTTVSRADGKSFDLYNFEFSDVWDFADDPVTITLVFDTGSAEIVKSFTADENYGMQVANVNVTGIRSFTLVTSGSVWDENTVTLDNFNYAVVVPEPATWAMLIAGFGLVGLTARRRRLRASA